MAQILVRNIEESVKKAIAARAARHGRSMEQEIRDILRVAAHSKTQKEPLGSYCARVFKNIGLTEDIPEALRGFKPKIPTF